MGRFFLKKNRLFLIFLAFLNPTVGFPQTARTRPPAEHLIVKCKLLIDPGSGTSQPGIFIETAGGKILRVGSAARLEAPADAKILDFGDKYIIPGLIDTHAHLYGGIIRRQATYELLAPVFLACGVTTIRSPGSGNPGGDLALRDRINAGCFDGPRIFISGAYLEADPPTVEWMNPLRTAEEARLTIESWAQKGATSIKLYASMKGDLMKAAVDHAHAHGLKAIAHIGAATYEESIRAGIDEIFHGVSVMSDLLPKDVDQRRYFEWFKAVLSMDLERPEIARILKLAAEANVVLTPTAAAFDKMDFQSEFLLSQKKYYAPDAWEALLKRSPKPLLEGEDKITALNLRFVRSAYDAGCILTTGTDKTNLVPLPGFSLWQEMNAFGRAGLPPLAVLKAATWNAAYALSVRDILGSVEPGKLADFVVLDRNPLEDINNVRSVHRVVKAGVVYNPEDLLKRAVGRIG